MLCPLLQITRKYDAKEEMGETLLCLNFIFQLEQCLSMGDLCSFSGKYPCSGVQFD